MAANVTELLRRGTAAINDIEQELKDLGAIGSSEHVPIEQFPTRIRGLAMSILSCIAPEFNKANEYQKGDYVTHDMKLYKFKSPKAANVDWNINIVDNVTVVDELGIKVEVTGTKTKFSN